MFGSRTARIRRARLVPIALTTAALSSAVLGASVTGTLSAFNASITNTTNTAASGSLVMRETGPDNTTTCLSSSGTNNNYATCGNINKYGGTTQPFTPGTTHTTSIKIENTGSATVGTFTLHPDACQKSDLGGTNNSGNLCSTLQLTLTCTPVSTSGAGTTVNVYNAQTLTQIAATGEVNIGSKSSTCVPVAGSGYVRFDFTLTLPTNADSSVQSQQVSQPLTWTFTGA